MRDFLARSVFVFILCSGVVDVFVGRPLDHWLVIAAVMGAYLFAESVYALAIWVYLKLPDRRG
jgi:uncharacterized membrane protein